MDDALDIINNSGAFVKGRSQFIKEVLREKVVDLGLPSDLKWAVCDIDIKQKDGFCKTPFTYDKSFFNWGNVDGHNSKNNAFDEPWFDIQMYGTTRGHTLTGDIPIDEEFDAARAILGGTWRMPKSHEFTELIDNCIFINADGTEVETSKVDKRVTVNGIIGLYLQSKTNGNRIFFAASGYGRVASMIGSGSDGAYWSSTYNSSRDANFLSFYDEGVLPESHYYRHLGFAVRAVHE